VEYRIFDSHRLQIGFDLIEPASRDDPRVADDKYPACREILGVVADPVACAYPKKPERLAKRGKNNALGEIPGEREHFSGFSGIGVHVHPEQVFRLGRNTQIASLNTFTHLMFQESTRLISRVNTILLTL
jgi:hypothetical protein